jgi:heme/copper-type cytochrome/quinol oxidase subunit 2
MFFIVAMYALAIIGWTAICYLIIKLWQARKKKKRAQREQDVSAEANELNSRR